MPNRIIKESICTSDTLNGLSAEEETFFYRLMVQCDDYGCMDARPSILRARCYPLRLDSVGEADVVRWLSALVRVGIVSLYQVDGRPYLYMVTWSKHQQIRAQKRRYPSPDAPDAACYQMIADDSICPRNPIQSNPNTNPSVSARTRSREHATPPPPAVLTFRAATSRYPPKGWFGRLEREIGDDAANLAFWEQVCMGWVGQGWKATNVAGMLEFYQRRQIPPGEQPSTRGRDSPRRNGGGDTYEHKVADVPDGFNLLPPEDDDE